MLYSDPFVGFPDSMAKLCDVLADKYELGVKTRAAYRNGDRAELLRLANEEYVIVEKNLRAFIKAFEKQWTKENKPYGFDVQRYRLGGLLHRIGLAEDGLITARAGWIRSPRFVRISSLTEERERVPTLTIFPLP